MSEGIVAKDQDIRVWGLHMGEHVGARPIEGGYVAIGWQQLGDLREYRDRDAYKTAIAAKILDAKIGAQPSYAGILYRFAHEMQAESPRICRRPST